MNLDTPVQNISRIGSQYQKRLNRLKIKTLNDLIFHFPHRYDDFSNMVSISQAETDKLVCIRGELKEIKNIRTFRRRMTLTQAIFSDDSGSIKALWFNQPYLINTFKKGDRFLLAGKISAKGRYLSSPAYEKIIPGKENYSSTHVGRLIPVYPETEKLSSRWLRFIIKPILETIKNELPEPLPETIRKENDLLPVKEAIKQIHFPDSLDLAIKAKKRFIFEELLILSLFILQEKLKLMKEKAKAVPINISLIKKFVKNLPFELTNDQKKAVWQILKDMERNRPMNRLLEGDVGSGKTVVATMAILNTAKKGFQSALMAPTEILARQHFKTVSEALKDFDLKIGLISGKASFFKKRKTTRKAVLEKTKKGEVDLLIGTHAIIQDEVKFKNLVLAIIDEQHRFGVDQRARLCQGSDFSPHLLSMTATPIPRTLSLTIYGDLDLSLIKEMPKGRKKIITKIVSSKEREKTYKFIHQKVKEGRQVFVICPRIDPPAKNPEGKSKTIDERMAAWLEVKAVKEEYEKLSKNIFPDLKIGLLHGKMKPAEKEKEMKNFKSGKTDILVSTSVVEVGIDIPNATIMMIEGAEKFGLAQLHQFRGRVGRGEHQSYCLLFSSSLFKTESQRLKALVSSENGFELAEKDLKIRGAGDFIGQRQWGIPDLTMASLKDVSLVEKTRETAKKILNIDPELKKHPFLKERLKSFQQKIHLE